jgi:hypothetical protein
MSDDLSELGSFMECFGATRCQDEPRYDQTRTPTFTKNSVHLLKRHTHCFRVEEVNLWTRREHKVIFKNHAVLTKEKAADAETTEHWV